MSYKKELETLETLLKTNIEKIQNMSLSDLKAVYEDTDTLSGRLILVKQWLNVAVSRKLGNQFEEIEPVITEDYRIATLTTDIFTVKQVKKKKVTWDQKVLSEKANKIRSAGDDPNLFMDIKYSINERKYSSWQECQKAPFREARHISYSEPEYLISLKEV